MIKTINIEGLSVSRGKNNVIDNLDFHAYKGEIVALVAPNGTGKTTLFNGLTHLINSKYRTLEIQGEQFSDRINFNQSFFFLESSHYLYEELTAIDHLKVIKKAWTSPISIEQTIKKLKMDDYSTVPAKKLSLGMKQHLLVAMYIVSNAPVLFFDEPLNGLDPGSIKIVNSLLVELSQDKTIIISSHDIYNIQEICTRVVFLKDKRLIKDTVELENISKIYSDLYE